MRWMLILLVVASPVVGQDDPVRELWDFYSQGEFQRVVHEGLALVSQGTNNAQINLAIGRSLVDMGQWQEGKPYLEKTVALDPQKTFLFAWAQVYLGRCHLLAGDLDLATKAFTEARECGATRNAIRTAAMNLRGLGLDEYFDDWITVETDHFIFNFSPRLGIMDRSGFILDREVAFQKISEWFGAKPEKKIRFFVWADHVEAELAGLPPLGFARATYHLIHAHVHQTRGHEITHVISYHAGKPLNTAGLVNEGIAIFHDQTKRDTMERAEKALARGAAGEGQNPYVAVGVRALWNDWTLLSDEYTYPLAGAWVDRLLAKGGKDQFLKFFTDQTYAHAQKIYGPDLEIWIDDFEAEVGIKN